MNLLPRKDLLQLFEDISTELERQNRYGLLFAVGGKTMALVHSTWRSAQDLDAVFEPTSAVHEAARLVGHRHGLPSDWINDAVKDLRSGDDPNATTLFERPGLSIRVVSPRYLFAAKAVAVRMECDANDLLQLYRLCGFSSTDEALDCVQGCYPPHLLPSETAFLLRELLDSVTG